MPLQRGKSKAAFSSNVRELMHAGHPQAQALAIAYSEKRRGAPSHKVAANTPLNRARKKLHYVT